MEAAAPVTNHVVEFLMTRIKKELGYWWNSRKNVDAMNEEMTRLNDVAKEIDRQMEQENVKGIRLPHVKTWLEDFRKIKSEAERIPTDGIRRGCFSIMKSHKAGKQSFDILEKMKSRLGNIPSMENTGPSILARVETKNGASTSGTADDGNGNSFKSREVIFKEALECLKPKNSKTQMIALCGMGGVGKSYMMEQLKKRVEDTEMFKWVVSVVVGQNTGLNALQHKVAEKTGGALTETTSDARAERLKNRFAEMSNGGEKKILVILDDLWEEVNLKHIGLTSLLPNSFKLLITSRKLNVCTQMRVDTRAIFNIGALKNDEAKALFFDTAELSEDNDPDLESIGEEIIKSCGNLPIALKVIASTLRGKTNKTAACKVARMRLQRHELKDHYEIVHKAFEISYTDLKEEKALFLLSGLFPDDFEIPVEELVRYGWGLKLFSKVPTFEEARLHVEIWLEDLMSANLLAKSDRVGCVKMHDLARAFALSDSVEVEQASIVNEHDILKQRTQPKSFKRILLKLSGMSGFPEELDCSDLAFLKLMDGGEQLKFPEDFHKSMKKLEVISYEGIQCPLLPESTNLRTLCLHGCKFTFDWSDIKKLVQLEVLSFAGSDITELPSEVGELEKLKLLDLRGCSADLSIADGVLLGLVSLEELYIKASGHKAISFTKKICEELKVISEKLSALLVEFFHKEDLPKNMSFPKLERFKISIGCLLEEDKDIYSFKNTLKLVTSWDELKKWKINKLFEKTEKLHLQVKDLKHTKHLMDVKVPPSQPCFSRLTELEVSECEDLKFLFPADVARAFMKLEHLKVSSCNILETLIHDESGDQESMIMFPKLKFLSLKELPQLTSLCDTKNRVELQQLVELILEGLPNVTSIYPDNKKQSFFNPQVAIPNLEKLKIYSMEKLEQIWPGQISTGNKEMVSNNNNSTVRVVKVRGCDSLINLFPTNPMPLLNKLEKLQVKECGSIDVLFNIDLGPPSDGGLAVTCSLRSIRVEKLGKLKVLWRINGANDSSLLSCFQSVENIHIHGCKRFSNIFTPTTVNFNMRASVDIRIQDSRDLVFNKALKSLQPDSKTGKIALCGVGSVGKTTMMEDLLVAAKDLRMFDSVVKLVIGRESDLFILQETTAKCIDEALKENATEERAKFLGQKFMQKSQGLKSKILVILDDLRQEMDLKDIGLPNPLPNGVKLLITSRDKNVCTQMAVEKSSIFRVPLLGGPEAKVLFYQTLRPSNDDAAADPELQKIAEDVVKICCGMPFLIKDIASLLKNKKGSTWEDAYSNLKQNDLNSIYQKWYNELETEDAKAILLLCGFFLKEADMPVEDLVRYGWGLKMFNDEVDTLAKARQLITNSVDVLIRANMLILSNRVGCVKMHHPLCGFVFSNLREVKQALIEHDNMPKAAKEPCERILLNCTGMSELPVGFDDQNLRLLKLIGDEELLEFPRDFYDRMNELEVVAYERMVNPFLPQFSTSLRSLCLDSCSLLGDFPFLGDLSNLEILSFAHCGIRKLPSTVGKLRRLKLLDVTGCSSDLSIDEGVFRGLEKLEELYLRVRGPEAIHFTGTNWEEFKILLDRLSALEVEFSENMLQPLSFEKLKRFNISMGCLLDDTDIDPSANTLNLGTHHDELLQSRIVKLLIKKTDTLCLQVKDMKNLEQFSMGNSFCNLKKLEVSECADLMFLFTVPVASGFTELESLKVSSCRFLETLIHDASEICGSVITFPKLKCLSLKNLPCLTSLCDADNRVELQQLLKLILDGLPNFTTIFPDHEMQPNAFFNKQIVIPKLEKLKISSMEMLKQIWPCEYTTTSCSEEEFDDISMVRVVEVQYCDSLVSLFPTNPMPLLLNLEKLKVSKCDSIEVLFDIDMGRVAKIEEVSSSLRSIHVTDLANLTQVWRIKGANDSLVICGFQAVENIRIHGECLSFKHIFTPKSTNFDMRAVVDIKMQDSRDFIFRKALKSLEPSNSKTQMISLCGMGGVGKTHMMERLKKEVEDSRMFYRVVKVNVPNESNLLTLQQAVAKQTGEALTETTTYARAEHLKNRFVEMSQDGEKKILVILDDIWYKLDLNYIGLPSPLPNGFKLLFTSRFESVCSCMGVGSESVFRIDLLDVDEAETLFFKTMGLSKYDNRDLYMIGEYIIQKSCGLPLILKLATSILKGQVKYENIWKDALSRLPLDDLDYILLSFLEMSYNNLKMEDEQAIFLLSGLFPDGVDIPEEKLVRYAWGLKLFSNVTNLAQARRRLKTCIDNLISANLLAESDRKGCVIMHDLVREYVLSNPTKMKQALCVDDHVDMRMQLKADAYKSYQRITLNCSRMSEFPKDFDYPNLKFLKLMDGDEQLKFPDDFCKSMEKLEVLSYLEMWSLPLLPRSLQYSTNLATLCLHGCKLISDCSSVGDLVSLEVLSFAGSGIKKLPSAIGKLKKLKLLDMTGCSADLCIDDGVLHSLVSLEELYIKVSGKKAIRLTDANCDELEVLSVKLSALEVEFFDIEALRKHMSFRQLERFKISMGCLLEEDKDIYSFKNTLKLATSSSKLLGSKINELFGKTEKLHLQLRDIKHLKDVILCPQQTFSKLQELEVSDCADLAFLFTADVASALTELEHLTVSSCPVLETLIHGESGGGGTVIMFPKLNFLKLKDLPRLMSLCDTQNRVELQQLVELIFDGLPNITSIYPDNAMQPYAFFNRQVQIPKLEELRIYSMEKLVQIWPAASCEITTATATGSEEEVDNNNNISMLRLIEVRGCESLVNLFPCNPLPLLNHLKWLEVRDCCSIQVLFNIDLRGAGAGAGNMYQVRSSLRSIQVERLENLREIWRIRQGGGNNSSRLLIGCFRAVEDVYISSCSRFEDIFTPKTVNFYTRARVRRLAGA